ncbi:S-norcoclaurine synthase 1-like [Iris pallida]|uniref:S-norcoclaurine synthase 1-like n=1 Tax=Iris pallida TaxID=29817 RepID=A0AAX6EWF4_IRIPA|nr:S-norcoclaurine synthase 1-like [Iris pallida]
MAMVESGGRLGGLGGSLKVDIVQALATAAAADDPKYMLTRDRILNRYIRPEVDVDDLVRVDDDRIPVVDLQRLVDPNSSRKRLPSSSLHAKIGDSSRLLGRFLSALTFLSLSHTYVSCTPRPPEPHGTAGVFRRRQLNTSFRLRRRNAFDVITTPTTADAVSQPFYTDDVPTMFSSTSIRGCLTGCVVGFRLYPW